MTDPTPATVAVPVELIKTKVQEYEDGGWPVAANEWRDLLPKLKPRLVAVDLGSVETLFYGSSIRELLNAKPDLLTLLDDVCDDRLVFKDAADLKACIRAALGVTE